MGDLINRQAAIDAICKACSMEGDYHKCDGYPEASTRCDELVALRAVPPAKPERPKGTWIPHVEKSREYIGTVLVNVEYDYWVCDTCGYPVKKGQTIYNFCPNCGAKMEVTE